MSNIRTLKYNDVTGKYGINIGGKTKWFDAKAMYKSNKAGYGAVKVDSQNFFFPINEALTSGGLSNPFNSLNTNKPSGIIPPIVFPRIRIDPNFWREAIFEMEMKPWNWRVKTQQMMQDVILDSHVKACWQKRKRLTLLKKPAFFDKSNNVIENNPDLDFITTDWWLQLCDYMLDAQGYGYQLIELGDLINNGFPDIGVVPRQNISPDREVVAAIVYNVNGLTFNINPQDMIQVGNKQIKTSSKSPNGQYYYDWTIWIKTPNEFGSHTSSCGYGIFYWIGLYSILIRNNLQNNADYNEKFLQPIRDLTTNKTDKKERQDAFQQLVDAGSSLTFLHDPEDELKLLQNTTSGQVYKTYADFEVRMKKAISALTLGHEDAMHSIPGKLGGSQGGKNSTGNDSPIQEALAETGSEQNRWLCSHINNNVLVKLRKLGFKIPLGIRYGYVNDDEEEEAQEKQNKKNIDFTTALVNLTQAGYDVDPKFIEEATGIPVTKKPVPKPQPQPKVVKPGEEDVPDEEELEGVKNFYEELKKQYGKHAH